MTNQRTVRWHTKVAVVILGLFIAGLAFKYANIAYNSRLFSNAERKMRSLPIPHSVSTVFEYSCSFKSTLNPWKYSPRCRVRRLDVYDLDDARPAEVAQKYFNGASQIATQEKANFSSTQQLEAKLSSKSVEGGLVPQVNYQGAVPKLDCYSRALITSSDYTNYLLRNHNIYTSKEVLLAITDCSKDSFIKLYQELN